MWYLHTCAVSYSHVGAAAVWSSQEKVIIVNVVQCNGCVMSKNWKYNCVNQLCQTWWLPPGKMIIETLTGFVGRMWSFHGSGAFHRCFFIYPFILFNSCQLMVDFVRVWRIIHCDALHALSSRVCASQESLSQANSLITLQWWMATV